MPNYIENEAIYVLKKNSKGKVVSRYEGFVYRILETQILVRYYDQNGTCYIQRMPMSRLEKR